MRLKAGTTIVYRGERYTVTGQRGGSRMPKPSMRSGERSSKAGSWWTRNVPADLDRWRGSAVVTRRLARHGHSAIWQDCRLPAARHGTRRLFVDAPGIPRCRFAASVRCGWRHARRPAGVAAGVVQAAAAHAHRMAAKAGRLARHGRPVAAAFATRRGSATAVARTAEAVMGVNSLAARLFLSGSAASRRGRWCRWQRLAAARGYRDRLAKRAPRQSGPSWACVRGVSPRATLGEAEP
jgi:hypothetical protein